MRTLSAGAAAIAETIVTAQSIGYCQGDRLLAETILIDRQELSRA
jgi:hypothetical protein